MPRFSRGSINTKYFHVMTQGINKSYIFDKPVDIKYYIKIMYELKEEYNLKIVAYCVMNNHTHMLIRVDKIEELSKYMQRLNSKYAHYYNKKNNRVGYVFRDRFKSQGIYSEKQFYACIKYIYDNPVKAGICSKPEQYPYSNYKSITVKKIDDIKYTFIDIEEKTIEYKSEIEKILNKNNLTIDEIRINHDKLKKCIKILKNKYNISLRRIAKELNIGRERVRNLYKE